MRAKFLFGSAAAVAALAAPSRAQTEFDSCGQLVQGVECVLFETADGDRYLLDDEGDHVVGDRLRVVGELDSDCLTVCLEGDGCVAVERLARCDGAVTVCGELVQGAACVLLEAEDGERYALAERGAFEVGDSVVVSGTLDAACDVACTNFAGCIEQNTIRAARLDDDCGEPGSPVCALTSLGAGLLGLASLARHWPRPTA